MTDTNDDPYADLKQHRAMPEMLTGSVPKKIQKQRQHFVKVPWRWVERLAKARHIATFACGKRDLSFSLNLSWNLFERPWVIVSDGM